MELTRVQYTEEPITLLYEAANTGSTTILKTLIQKDKLILDKVTLSFFTETPLHISALLGHLDFTIAILEKCPTMALEQDSLKCLPLHLAASKGHSQIVKALLNTDKSSCLSRDAEGRIPLHLAVIRGRADVIQELVAANSESFSEVLNGDTVFHLCVKHNHLEVLKLLVRLINDYEIINLGNQGGNSVLHLAAMLKQLETLRYLLSLQKIKAKSNSLNGKGLTALDLLDECPTRDFKTLQIQNFLINQGLTRANNTDTKQISHDNFQPNAQQQSPSTAQISSTQSKPKKNLLKKLLELSESDWKEIRGALMIVATVVATVSFQAAMNPPGGVWQQEFKDETGSIVCNATHVCEAGTAILASTYPNIYALYILSNSFAFASSVSVIVLMIGGFSLRIKFFLWVFALSIIGTVFFLSLSYISGVWSLTLSRNARSIRHILLIPLVILEFVFVVLGIIYLVRFVIWTVKNKHWRRIKNKLVSCMNCDEGA